MLICWQCIMRPLEQVQSDFLAMLAGQDAMDFGDSRVVATQTKTIYRRNYRENRLHALADTYEHALALVGRDYFRQLARRYVDLYPGESGDLNDYGEYFAEFLEQLLPAAPGGDNLAWLPDIARLDWARLQALRAPEEELSGLPALLLWPAEQQGEVRMRLHSSCTLINSGFPLYSLWLLARGDDQSVDLAAGAEPILICRIEDEVHVHALDVATAFLLQHWQTRPLAASLEVVHQSFPDTPLATLFASLNTLGAFADLWRETE